MISYRRADILDRFKKQKPKSLEVGDTVHVKGPRSREDPWLKPFTGRITKIILKPEDHPEGLGHYYVKRNDGNDQSDNSYDCTNGNGYPKSTK